MNSIVIVEDRANMPLGHFPNEFAKLADGFVDLGLNVDVLTRRGWWFEGSRARAWNLHEAGPLADRLLGIARRGMATSGYFAGRSERAIGFRAHVGALLRTAVLIVSARRLARSSSGESAPIVVVAMDFVPALLVIFGGADRWLIWQYTPEISFSRLARVIDRIRCVCRRPARQVTLAVHFEHWLATVSERLPCFEVVDIPLVASRNAERDRDASRAALGLDAGVNVALLFAAGHREQFPEVVLEAFQRRPDWQLVIGGAVCERLAPISTADWGTPPLMFGNFVEDAIRERLFSSADLVVLSFVSKYRLSSGTVMDAASLRLPIVVSSGSLASDLVEQTGAGEVFDAESPKSLLEALDRLDAERAREGSGRLREMYSLTVVCRAHLDVLGSLDASA